MEDQRHVKLADVHRVLKGLADAESRLSFAEERAGNDTESLMHAHGVMVLHEALAQLRFQPDE